MPKNKLGFIGWIYLFILRRKPFKGQFKLFLWLYHHQKLPSISVISKSISANFLIYLNTKNYIDASIYFTGDYEFSLKKIFKKHIKTGDFVLDIGANIGFHTLYFAELVGNTGKVTAFEPISLNFDSLKKNIALNKFRNIEAKNIALGHKNEMIYVNADPSNLNPGSFNLFNSGTQAINCFRGDEIVSKEKVDFIKIDVEGYESFVLEGLMTTITTSKPKIVFEYDINYHQKTNLKNDFIFNLLRPLGYQFYQISNNDVKVADFSTMISCNILALPNV